MTTRPSSPTRTGTATRRVALATIATSVVLALFGNASAMACTCFHDIALPACDVAIYPDGVEWGCSGIFPDSTSSPSPASADSQTR